MLDHMQDREQTVAPDLTWQERLEAIFSGAYLQLAEGLTGVSPKGGELDISLVKEGRHTLGLKISALGQDGFLKVFDGPDAADSYKREKAALLSLAGRDLVPDMICFSDELRFVITEWHGQEFLPAVNPEGTARRIGAWIARYDAVAPSRALQGDWYSYCVQLGLEASLKNIPGAKERLTAVPLCGEVLSRDDSAMHNFLEGPDGRLLGCDFERSRFKPRGWEYMRAHWSLLQRFPDQAPKVQKALERGFDLSHRGVLRVDEISTVARILFCAQAIKAAHKTESHPWQ